MKPKFFVMADINGRIKSFGRALPRTSTFDSTDTIGGRFWSLLARARRVIREARAWWLVEAESADAARKIIAYNEPWPATEPHRFAPPGRILASGGAK